MSYSPNRGFPAGNPIANALVVIVGALVIGASIVLGFFAFVVLACLLLVGAGIIGIRLWWFNRKLSKAAKNHPNQQGPAQGHVIIEGEYQVVEQRRGEQGGDT